MAEMFSRWRAAYVMIFLAVLVVGIGAWNVHRLQGRVDDFEQSDCFQDNVMRKAVRLALVNPVIASAESRRILAMPELAVEDCQ